MPVLAIHGWLDNSAGFEQIASLLPQVHMLAPDLAGHGLSDHRPALLDYSLMSEIAELKAMVDDMGWDRFAVMGHSRGGMIAMILAALIPERVSHIVLLDMITMPPVSDHQSISRLQQHVNKAGLIFDKRSLFSSYDEAIFARMENEFGCISRINAERLAERGLSQKSTGFYWHADPKLKILPATGLNHEQIRTLYKKVQAPVLALMGKNGWLQKVIADNDLHTLTEELIDSLSINVHELDGGHFVHMEEQVSNVVTLINQFLNSQEH